MENSMENMFTDVRMQRFMIQGFTFFLNSTLMAFASFNSTAWLNKSSWNSNNDYKAQIKVYSSNE